ncbi:hypothetical protein CKALI_09460 [Corynebacterium kalinowskii]|uniref:Secreted protein n=1 Tax=Corynebacterium kalinowskii TaxID=2675216 RepID=A0A6B8VSX4_9CORY|nr:hypothetical protein [Corynebacterium kalinowskii]QGU02747.1 hypothetical protein CKALI_09460 [Corynebacterium kalinowskii]
MVTFRIWTLAATALLALASCSTDTPHDALARLKPEPGPSITLPASELLAPDAQTFLVVCPGVPADTVSEIAGDSVKVPGEGYDPVLNSFVVLTSDGSVVTQRFAIEEIDLCSRGYSDPLTKREASLPLTFVKEGTQWLLTAN